MIRNRTGGNIGYLFGELLRSLHGRSLGALLIANGLLIFFLLVLSLSLLVWGSLGHGAGGEVFALLTPGLSPEEIDRLYLQIRGWDEVARVQLILQEELAQGKRTVPLAQVPDTDLFIVFLQRPQDAPAVKDKLNGLSGIQRVISYGQGSLLESLHSAIGGALRSGVLVLLGLIALLAVRWAIQVLIASWRGELQLLSLSGVSPRRLAWPFVYTGLLCGFGSGLLVWLIIYLLHLWGMGQPELFYRTLPALLSSSSVIALLFLDLCLGLVIGLLGSAWATMSIRRL